MSRRVFISAGEASGDALGAALIREMRAAVPDPTPRMSIGFQDRLARLLGQQLPLDLDADLLEVGVEDSLSLVEVVMSFEDEFSVDLTDDEVNEMRTVGDLVRTLAMQIEPEQNPELPIRYLAVGGLKLSNENVTMIANSSSWGAVGIVQSLRVAPRAAIGLAKAKAVLSRGNPGLFIPIDFGFFNVRLARFAKEKGWKVLYFMPPGSWRRDKQGRDLPAIADAVVTPFPWSADILRGMGANAHWFGHPLKQMLRESRTNAPAHAGRGETIAILPGSRKHEVDLNLPLIAKALPDGVAAEFAVAPTLNAADLELHWKQLAPTRTSIFTSGDTAGVLSRARAGLVCSGTATLEAALLRCPSVVLYRVSQGTALQAKIAGFKPSSISLPNLLLERQVVPEHVGTKLDADAIARDLNDLMEDSPKRQAQLDGFDEIDAILGPDDAITKTAELAISMLA